MNRVPEKPLDIFLVAGETSGDQLGAKLMMALKRRLGGRVRFRGVGGGAMGSEGLASLFPMEDVTAIGIWAVAVKIPTILRRLRETVAAIRAAPPDLLILIDSPDFTHRVGKRVRRALPDLTIVKYVAPTVWVWRPRRARAMRPFVDHILAVLPFEPKVVQRLGGPPCSYIGHPLLEHMADLRPSPEELAARKRESPLVLVLPGSRRLEISRLGSIFADAIGRVAATYGRIDFVLPTLPALANEIAAAVTSWPVQPRIVTGEAEKYAAFRRARAALAASGTVTLELALAEVPMITAYKVPLFEELIMRAVVQVKTPILVDLALGENVVPVFLQRECTAERLAAALLPLLGEGAERKRQLDAFARLDQLFKTGGEPPSAGAARIAIETFEKKTGRRAPRA